MWNINRVDWPLAAARSYRRRSDPAARGTVPPACRVRVSRAWAGDGFSRAGPWPPNAVRPTCGIRGAGKGPVGNREAIVRAGERTVCGLVPSPDAGPTPRCAPRSPKRTEIAVFTAATRTREIRHPGKSCGSARIQRRQYIGKTFFSSTDKKIRRTA